MDHILPYLFFLACPISMGVMMWIMMRNHNEHGPAPTSDPRVADLESQVNELRMALHGRQGSEAVAAMIPTTNAEKD